MSNTERIRVLVTPLVAGAILIALIMTQLVLSHSLYLFSHMFWFDEIVTDILVTDPAFSHAAAALWKGVDNNIPGLFVALRAFTSLIGSTSESTFRVFSFLCVLIGLCGVYRSLCRCFPPLVTFATVIAVWTHPLILHHAFNARFYGPLFAAAVWFSYFLSCAPTARHRVRSNVAIAVSAVALCTVHYFGVLSLLLVVLGELLYRRRTLKGRFAGFAAATAGLLALVASAPLLVSHLSKAGEQRGCRHPACSGWWFGTYLMLPVPGHRSIGCLDLLCHVHASSTIRSEFREEADLLSVASLSALALMPLVLLVFSYLVQPVLIPQYAISAVAGLAPGIALVLSRVSRTMLVALCAFFLLVGAQRLRDEGSGIGTWIRGGGS